MTTSVTAQAPSIAKRLALLEQLFEAWAEDGIPDDVERDVLASFTKSTTWRHERLGVFPIISPNDRSQKEGAKHCDLARDVDKARKKLLLKFSAPLKRKSATQQAKDLSGEKDELAHMLAQVKTQWDTARAATQAANDSLGYQIAINKSLEDRVAFLNDENAALTRSVRNLEEALAKKLTPTDARSMPADKVETSPKVGPRKAKREPASGTVYNLGAAKGRKDKS